MITHKQISLAEIFEDRQNEFDNDKPALLSLLETHINLDEIIPITFCNHFYASTGRTKADMTIFDSSGIEAFVTENNPKYANRIIKQLKAYVKAQGFDKSFDPYKAAYGSMSSHASANPEIKQLYINGHFCYVFKFGIVTNGLGIIRHIFL